MTNTPKALSTSAAAHLCNSWGAAERSKLTDEAIRAAAERGDLEAIRTAGGHLRITVPSLQRFVRLRIAPLVRIDDVPDISDVEPADAVLVLQYHQLGAEQVELDAHRKQLGVRRVDLLNELRARATAAETTGHSDVAAALARELTTLSRAKYEATDDGVRVVLGKSGRRQAAPVHA